MDRGPAISGRASCPASTVEFAIRQSGDHDPGRLNGDAAKRPREFGRNGDAANPGIPDPLLSCVRPMVGTSAAPIPGSVRDAVPPDDIPSPTDSRPVGLLVATVKRREECVGSVAVKNNWE